MFTTIPFTPAVRRGGRVLVLTVLTVLVALPGTVAAVPHPRATAAPTTSPVTCPLSGHDPADVPAIAFGHSGGSIRPLRIAIYPDGTITYQGTAPLAPAYTISPAAVRGLQRLAAADGFWTMPDHISSPGVLPDVASRFVALRIGCSTTTHTVQVHGGDLGDFDELYETLLAAVAVPSGATSSTTEQLGPRTITLQNANQTLRYTPGARVLIKLGDADHWTLTFSNPNVFTRVPSVLLLRSAQDLFIATRPGQTTLTAIGDPICRLVKPPCEQPSLTFDVSLIVQPAP